LAVNPGAAATHELFVETVMEPFAFALAPVAGRVNVTAAPATGLPLESFTAASKGVENAPFTAALWPDPWIAAMATGAAPANSGAEQSETVP
jgi:hypothetical protein